MESQLLGEPLAPSATGSLSARQAVCAADRRLIGYEVLTADAGAPAASARSSARALLAAFSDVDLDLLSPRHPAYLTISPALLRRLDLLPVAPDRVVLQLECGEPLHEETSAALARLDGLGYVFAAKDPVDVAAVDALEVAGLARVSVAGLEPETIAERLAPFHDAGLRVHVTGVDDLERFEAASAAGCEGFQGAFRALPAVSQPTGGDPIALADIGPLLAHDLDFAGLERLIARDLALAYRLLCYANSAFFSQRREIGTVSEATALLGERMTRRWILVVALAAPERPIDDGLLLDALLRARMLALLSASEDRLDPEHAFTVGLLSMLPSLLSRPMEAALASLSLPRDIRCALLDGHPPYGPLLDRVVCHLDGDFRQASDPIEGCRVDAAFREALAWLAPIQARLQTAPAVPGR